MAERLAPGTSISWLGKTGEVIAFIPKGETIRSAVRSKMGGLAYLAVVRHLARRNTDDISQRDRYLIQAESGECPPAGVVSVVANSRISST